MEHWRPNMHSSKYGLGLLISGLGVRVLDILELSAPMGALTSQ